MVVIGTTHAVVALVTGAGAWLVQVYFGIA